MSEVPSPVETVKKEIPLWVIGAAIFVIVFGPALAAWVLSSTRG